MPMLSRHLRVAGAAAMAVAALGEETRRLGRTAAPLEMT